MSTAERYVTLGLAPGRSPWFAEVARWSTVASIPVEFVKCVSAEEVRARLASGRRFSALLVDAGVGAADRDLFAAASEQGCVGIVVDRGGSGPEWRALGAVAVLAAPFGRDELVAALAQHASPIGGAGALPLDAPAATVQPSMAAPWRGRLVAVTGPGGTGASTVAIALAQTLGDDVRNQGAVLLADLALDAEQAMLHDADDVMPGLAELVDAYRTGAPRTDEVLDGTFDVIERRYRLLLGLRRHRDWSSLRARSFEAAVDGLRASFAVVVADVDRDLEGEAQCGSFDVEERNLMARTVVGRADAVVLVGHGGVKGVHALVRTIDDVRSHGVDPGRIVVVVNRATRNRRARAELTRALAELTGARAGGPAVVGPVFVPERRNLDDLHRDGGRLPGSLGESVAAAVRVAFDRAGPVTTASSPPVAVAPGSLGASSGDGAGSW